jgi:hypothetical protein
MFKILQVLRTFINVEKFRSRASKEEPIEVRSPITKEEIIAEVCFLLYMFAKLFKSI